MTNNEKENKIEQPVIIYDVKLRELESLLRKKLGDELVVIKYSSESLLPIGENYGSTILKVQATIKRKNDADEEDLHLIAKMNPATEMQRLLFDSPFTFKKEAFLYEELIPSYQRLEREFGVKDDEVFNIVPELYGVRYSLQPDVEFDDDAVILMQNLKVLGYYTYDRVAGLDFIHAKTSIIGLAQFHALGMAMKYHKPDYFEILKMRSKCLEIKGDEKFEVVANHFKQIMRDDPIMSVYIKHIEAAMAFDTAETWTQTPKEPWSTIVHMDFWINNIMFRDDPETKKVIDVKFVDFQNYLFMSPLRELVFFLAANLNADCVENKFDELIDCYYDTFIGVLKKMKCDIEPFSRDKFDEQLKRDALYEFQHCPFMIKVMTTDVKPDIKPENFMNFGMLEPPNPFFLERMRRCIKIYADRGWFNAENE